MGFLFVLNLLFFLYRQSPPLHMACFVLCVCLNKTMLFLNTYSLNHAAIFFPSTSISCTCRISSLSLNERDWCCRSLPACRVASRSDYFQHGCSKIIKFRPLPMSAISHGNPCYGGVFEFLNINSWLSGLCEVLNILLVSVRREF